MPKLRAARLDILVSISCLALLGYISWHIYIGPRGMTYRDNLASEFLALEQQRDIIIKERVALDKRARLLRPESIDPDLVEELARRDLAMARKYDLIIRLNN